MELALNSASSAPSTTQRGPLFARFAAARRISGGITSLAMLGLAVLALVLNLPNQLLAGESISVRQDVVKLGALLALWIAVQAPFDWLNGYLVPRLAHRHALRWWSFIFTWLRAVLVQGIVLGVVGLSWIVLYTFLSSVVQNWFISGTNPLVAYGVTISTTVFLVVALGLLLLAVRLPLALLVGPLTLARADTSLQTLRIRQWGQSAFPRRVRYLLGQDDTFTGGPALLGHAMPEAWFRRLEPEHGAVQLLRRAWLQDRGAFRNTLMLVLGWWAVGALAGLAIMVLVDRGSDNSVAFLGNLLCWATVWHALGQLVFTPLARRAVYTTDRALVAAGVPLSEVEDAIARLDNLQEDEPTRPRWAERLYAIPSVDLRIKHLNRYVTAAVKPKLGNASGAFAASTLQYMGWVQLSLLCRSTRTTSGRPELWVLGVGE